jgi:hypothetical protein
VALPTAIRNNVAIARASVDRAIQTWAGVAAREEKSEERREFAMETRNPVAEAKIKVH